MGKGRGGKERTGMSEQGEAREGVEVELCHLVRTLQPPIEQGMRQTLLHPTRSHVGSNSQVSR